MMIPGRLGCALLCLIAQVSGLAEGDDALTEGFEQSTFAAGFDEPIAMAFAPDGRLFVAQKGGTIRVIDGGVVSEAPFASIEVYTLAECGLLNLVLDPEFSENHFIYLFATVTRDEQQIIRLTDVDGVGRDRTLIKGGLSTGGQIHNGGGLAFGGDGRLYFSIGDTGRRELSQRMNSFAGKVCRINRDGSTPVDNPFVTPTGTPRAIHALGFRNPFRLCFSPDGRLFVMDVGSTGPARREEINLVERGNNHGWPEVEGFAADDSHPEFTNPIFDYGEKGSAIAGCAFYAAEDFPAKYQGQLFHLDFVSNALFLAELENNAVVRHTKFLQAEGGPVDLAVGPDGALYYAELYTGRIQRVAYTAASEGNSTDPAPSPSGDPSDPSLVGLAGPRVCGSGVESAALTFFGLVLRRRRFKTR